MNTSVHDLIKWNRHTNIQTHAHIRRERPFISQQETRIQTITDWNVLKSGNNITGELFSFIIL